MYIVVPVVKPLSGQLDGCITTGVAYVGNRIPLEPDLEPVPVVPPEEEPPEQ